MDIKNIVFILVLFVSTSLFSAQEVDKKTNVDNALTRSSTLTVQYLEEKVFQAAWKGDVHALKQYVELNNGDVNLKHFSTYFTLLIIASKQNHVEIIKYLIYKHVNLNDIDNLGQTALIHAAKAKNFEIVKLLTEAGADIKLKDLNGLSAFDYASKESQQGFKILSSNEHKKEGFAYSCSGISSNEYDELLISNKMANYLFTLMVCGKPYEAVLTGYKLDELREDGTLPFPKEINEWVKGYLG